MVISPFKRARVASSVERIEKLSALCASLEKTVATQKQQLDEKNEELTVTRAESKDKTFEIAELYQRLKENSGNVRFLPIFFPHFTQ